MLYQTINDLLRNELKEYYQFCKEKIGYISSVEDLFNFDISDEELMQEKNSDDDSEKIYENLNDYINLNADEEFEISENVDTYTSATLKLIIMEQLYEYVLSNYDLSSMDERIIFDTLVKNPSVSKALELYNDNYQTVLNLYCIIVLDSLDNSNITKWRYSVVSYNKIDELIKIDPLSILDYRFLYGCKFENEELVSVLVGKKLLHIVNDLILDDDKNKDPLTLKKCIHKFIDKNIEVSNFIEQNQQYIITNIYEHLLQKQHLDNLELNYINTLENSSLLEFLNMFFKMDNSVEFLLHMFYVFNYEGINEEKLRTMRDNTIKKGKIKVIEKFNPYYIEENNYFENK